MISMATSKKKSSKDPCWDGYEKVGMKMKNGKSVPDCVPVKKSSRKKTAAKKATPKKSVAKKASPKKASPKKAANKKAGTMKAAANKK